jgi:environmental stress-induced protein Ves
VNVTHLRRADYVRQNWKNGGGTTTELARDAVGERWRWRLSIADVERAGPFSDFTGYRRIITLLEGRGMALTFDGAPPVVIDRRYLPLAFDGGLRTECRLLGGPIRDMNLIVDDARLTASVDIRMPADVSSLDFTTDACALLHAIRGRFETRIGEHGVRLQPGDTLRVDDGDGETLSTIPLDADAVLAWMDIRHRGQGRARYGHG